MTSYANAGGTGNRTASITVTSTLSVNGTLANIVNGNLTETNWYFNGEAVSGKVIKFDFGVGASKVIDTFRWKQSTDQDQGTWQWKGSNDDSSYTSLGSSFLLKSDVAGIIKEYTEPAGNTTGYRYYELFGISGNTNSGPWQQEIEFKIDDAATGVAGELHATEATDVVALSGGVVATGTLGVTDAADVVSFIGLQPATGTLTATEAPDVLTFGAGFEGYLAIGEDSDVAAFTSQVLGGEAIISEAADLLAFEGFGRRRAAVVAVISDT